MANDRFSNSTWALGTPSDPAKPSGSWATFSFPTPGATPRITPRPSSAGPKTPSAKTPKGRAPRFGSDGGSAGYFDIKEGISTEGTKTPTPAGIVGASSSNGKGKGRAVDEEPMPEQQNTLTESPLATTDHSSSSAMSTSSADSDHDRTFNDAEEGSDDDDSDAGEQSPSEIVAASHQAQHEEEAAEAAAANRTLDTDDFVMVEPPTPGASQPRDQESFRPSLYTQASRSLINLSSASDRRMDADLSQFRTKMKEQGFHIQSPSTSPKKKASPTLPPPSRSRHQTTPSSTSTIGGLTTPTRPTTAVSPINEELESGMRSPPPLFSPGIHGPSPQLQSPTASSDPSLVLDQSKTRRTTTPADKKPRRRRSMGDIHAAPPVYALPVHGSGIPVPRDEEGKEGLPKYSCNVHIEGYLPRKMEFSSPGVQAKDRAWKRQYFGECSTLPSRGCRPSPSD